MNKKRHAWTYLTVMAVLDLGCGLGLETSSPLPPEPSGDERLLKTAAQPVLDAWTVTSEETAPVGCGAGSLINAMRCTGGYCDNPALRCTPTATTFGDTYWAPYFSEEGTNHRICAGNYWMTGLTCRGGHCDDVAIQCTQVTNRLVGTCRWAEREFSEELPNDYVLPDGWYARGLACAGPRCDRLRVYECRLGG